MESAVIVAPGRPADIHALIKLPDISKMAKSTSRWWSKEFQHPGFRKMKDDDVLLPAILTIRDHRGEVVDVLRMDLHGSTLARPGTSFTEVIPIRQDVVDILAVLLADRTTPGHWSLKWDQHVPLPQGVSLPTDEIDSGPIFSALHRAWHDIIPSGCAPCKDADADTAVGTWTKGLVPA